MGTWDQVASDERIVRAAGALEEHGIEAIVVRTGAEAKELVMDRLPEGAEVFTENSTTLQTLGITQEVDGSGRYVSVRNQLNALDRATDALKMQKLGAAPDWALGSVHAVTEEGSVLVASRSGSQLGAYAYGAMHVVWVVGAQKIVKDVDEGIRRIYEHSLPLERERAMKAYGIVSDVNKMLIINAETVPGRITMVIVKEVLGF